MPTPNRRPQESELLLKGVICALIGAIILLAPYLARSPDVREMMAGVYLAGWFALVLGCALLARWGLARWGGGRGR